MPLMLVSYACACYTCVCMRDCSLHGTICLEAEHIRAQCVVATAW
jgi:hypothetical protein